MRDVAKIIYSVMQASGSIAKSNILYTNKDNAKLREVLRFIYNPYNRCCIGTNKLVKALERTVDNGTTDPLLVIKYLSENNTGSDEAANYAARFVHSVAEANSDLPYATAIAMGFVMQDLQIGTGVKTLNTVFGADFIPTVGCMLGKLYADVKEVHWPCIITEKLDGIRRILIKENGICRMFSRSGHEDTGCVDILEEAKYLPDNMVYDGELLAIGNFKNNIEWRQATNSIANSKGVKHGLTFNLFDMLPISEFYAGQSRMNALNRKILLGAYFGDEGICVLTPDWVKYGIAYRIEYEFKLIKPVPILGLANNLDQVTPIVEAIWKQHGEGVMLNTVVGLYQIKRSKELLKVKFAEEKVLKIVGFTEGNNSLEDSLGAFLVEYKGTTVGVSGQLSRDLRQRIWNNKDEYLGKMIEVETFGESVNQTGGVSLNCPIFKRFVGEEE